MAIETLAARLAALEKRVAVLETGPSVGAVAPTSTKGGKRISIKEFMLLKQPKNDVEKTLTICYYLEKYEQSATSNIDDISNYYQLAKESTPSNVNDKVNMNIKKGHMSEANERKNNKKAWFVTASGERIVENGFKSAE